MSTTDFDAMSLAELEAAVAEELRAVMAEGGLPQDKSGIADRVKTYCGDLSRHIEVVVHAPTAEQKAAGGSVTYEIVPKTAWGYCQAMRAHAMADAQRKPFEVSGPNALGEYTVRITARAKALSDLAALDGETM